MLASAAAIVRSKNQGVFLIGGCLHLVSMLYIVSGRWKCFMLECCGGVDPGNTCGVESNGMRHTLGLPRESLISWISSLVFVGLEVGMRVVVGVWGVHGRIVDGVVLTVGGGDWSIDGGFVVMDVCSISRSVLSFVLNGRVGRFRVTVGAFGGSGMVGLRMSCDLVGE